MARILFLEDNLPLIDELAELLQVEQSGIETRFAVTIDEGLHLMRQEEFDLVVLDVMLPAYPDVPAQDEGIYLAAWVLGKTDNLPSGLKSERRSNWLDDLERRPDVMFLTSRTRAPVSETLCKLVKDDAVVKGIEIVERLDGDAYDHCKKVLDILKLRGERHGRSDI